MNSPVFWGQVITAEITLISASTYLINKVVFFLLIVSLAVSVISGIIGLLTLFGEAKVARPNLNDPWVKRPHAICLLSFIVGFIIFIGQLPFLQQKPEKNEPEIKINLTREHFRDLKLENEYSTLKEDQKEKVLKYIQQINIPKNKKSKK